MLPLKMPQHFEHSIQQFKDSVHALTRTKIEFQPAVLKPLSDPLLLGEQEEIFEVLLWLTFECSYANSPDLQI